MKPAPFAYHDPTTIAGAAELLGRFDNARPLAGGQSLVPMMNFRLAMPDHIVDLNGVAELAGITVGETVSLGAMTRQRDIEFHQGLAEACPILREALLQVGHRQTRNRGTIGGSLCHLDPAAEMPAVMTLLDATLHAAAWNKLPRQISMRDFAVDFMDSALEPGELLTRVEFAPWAPRHGWAWREFARRHGDFALAAAGVLVALTPRGDIDRLAIVISGLGPRPVRLTSVETAAAGAKANDALVAAAVAAASGVSAQDDIHASAAYRQRIAGVMAERALRAAFERARVGSPAHV